MLVLQEGLHQGIFKHFIREVERNPYLNFPDLEKALLKEIASKKMREKLQNLAPGQVRSTLSTYTTQPHKHNTRQSKSSTSKLQDKLEQATNVLVNAATTMRQGRNYPSPEDRKQQKCFDFSAGRCSRGANCKYSHTGTPTRKRSERTSWSSGTNEAGPNRKRQRGQKDCIYHPGAHSHDTQDCRKVKRATAKAHFDSRNTAAVNAIFDAQEDDEQQERHALCTHVMALPQDTRQLDRWCVDGASETNATFSRERCYNIKAT